MTDLLAALKKLYRAELVLLEIPILMEGRVGTEISLKLSSGEVIASGSGVSKESAIRICIAEAFERGLVRKISDSQILSEVFNLDQFPTTCGFAAGFENEKTRLRAISEGLERWAWSKWIDDKCGLTGSIVPIEKLHQMSHYYLSKFMDHKAFTKRLSLTIDGKIICFELKIFLGLTEGGIFAGSRVSLFGDEFAQWDHALLEAYRCLKNYNLSKVEIVKTQDVISKRAIFFGDNKRLALEQIESAQIQNREWPKPEIYLLKEYVDQGSAVNLWRCLIKDYIGWHVGDERRFVY